MPEWRETVPHFVAKHHWPRFPEAIGEALRGEVLASEARLRARYAEPSSLRYVSLIAGLCREGRCRVSLPAGRGRRLLQIDRDHSGPEGSDFVVSTIIAPQLPAGMPGRGDPRRR